MTAAQVRPASTVLALRPADAGFEVLMVRRAGASACMGGAHVFPGGAIDPIDRGDEAAAAVAGDDADFHPWWAAGLRELAEEAGVYATVPDADPSGWAGLHGTDLYRAVTGAGCRFAGDRLIYVSNWVTPPGPPRRFDTRFFLVQVPAGTPATPDGHEVTEAVWATPQQALANPSWTIPLPTRWHLELLARHPTADATIAAARQADVPRIAPQVVPRAGGRRILLPGEPGFDEDRQAG